MPAASSFLQSFAPFIGALDPALTQLNPLLQYVGAYKGELMSFAVNVTAATQATLGSPGHIYHYLRGDEPGSAREPRRVSEPRGDQPQQRVRLPGRDGSSWPPA